MEPEMVVNYGCEVGEGPLWHPLEKCLYWSDIPQGRMFRYDPATGHHEKFYDGPVVGGFTIQADGSLLLFMEKGAIAMWRDSDLRYITDGLPGEEENRFNDVFADTRGRVFCGTMPMDTERVSERRGTLYLLDTDTSVTPVLRNLGCSNGMGLTSDLKQLNFTDTMVDAEGYVWSAQWGGACIIRYSPDGKEDRRIPFPTRQVSSAIFGGEDYHDLYVTTAGGQDKTANGEDAGALFRVNPGVKGVPEFHSRVGI